MRKRNESAEEMRGRFLEICPDTIIALQELITDPNTATTVCRYYATYRWGSKK